MSLRNASRRHDPLTIGVSAAIGVSASLVVARWCIAVSWARASLVSMESKNPICPNCRAQCCFSPVEVEQLEAQPVLEQSRCGQVADRVVVATVALLGRGQRSSCCVFPLGARDRRFGCVGVQFESDLSERDGPIGDPRRMSDDAGGFQTGDAKRGVELFGQHG